jgi:hypothetical protein
VSPESGEKCARTPSKRAKQAAVISPNTSETRVEAAHLEFGVIQAADFGEIRLFSATC